MLWIGTAGYSYDDWIGPVYPHNIKKKEMLQYYAQFFSMVEVNFTYYQVPNPFIFAQFLKKTPPGFTFVVKAHRSFTHERKKEEKKGEAFCAALAPLQGEDRLGAVLLQFPWSFKNNQENREYLKWVVTCFPEMDLVVEFRHASWIKKPIFTLLSHLQVGYVCVDEPQLEGLVPPVTVTTSPIGYLRFHGRNQKDWWQPKKAYQRYNYLYSQEELTQWLPGIERLKKESSRLYISFNNHYQGKAFQNARTLMTLLGLEEKI